MNILINFLLILLTLIIFSCHPEDHFHPINEEADLQVKAQPPLDIMELREGPELIPENYVFTTPALNEMPVQNLEPQSVFAENKGGCNLRLRLVSGACPNCPTPIFKIEGYEQTNSQVPLFSQTVALTNSWHSISVSKSFVLFVTYLGCSMKNSAPTKESACIKPLEIQIDEIGFNRISSALLPRVLGLKIWVAAGTWSYFPPYPKPGQGGKFICEDLCIWQTNGFVSPYSTISNFELWLIHTQTGTPIKGQTVSQSGGPLNRAYYPIATGEDYHFVSWVHGNGGPHYCFDVLQNQTPQVFGVTNGSPLILNSNPNCQISAQGGPTWSCNLQK